MKKKQAKNWLNMNTEELARKTAEFDQPNADSEKQFRPLTAKERVKWEQFVSGHVVSIFVDEDGTKKIEVHLDDDLMADVRKYVQKNKTSIPEMIDKGLRGLIAFSGQ